MEPIPFGEALSIADVALVSRIYAAREEPIKGISARLIADAVQDVEFIEGSNDEIIGVLRQRLKPNDLFITLGAGDVHEISEALAEGAA